jgi:hypothetical protein
MQRIDRYGGGRVRRRLHQIDCVGVARDGRQLGKRDEFKTRAQTMRGGEIAQFEPMLGGASFEWTSSSNFPPEAGI